MKSNGLSAIDLFAGAGGISAGLLQAGYQVLLANELDNSFADTYELNHAGVHLVRGDIRALETDQITTSTGLHSGELDLLIGGPPCQGFSIIGSRARHDIRNHLFRDLLRLGAALRPRAIVIENVPGISTLAGGAYLREIREGLEQLQYRAAAHQLVAAQYGTPQLRWRMIIIAFRADLDIPGGAGFPTETHGGGPIGSLLPNRTLQPWETKGFVTTGQAIADLPAVSPGEEVGTYLGRPESLYQQEMRQGMGTELWNHYAPRLSPLNIERISRLSPGQDWRDLPAELLPESMRRAKKKDHTRRFRRMTWEGVPRSIITRFRDPKSGEYTHPAQNRTISIREAARIQGFPDAYRFLGDRSSQYDQVGNAVPVQLAKAVSMSVADALAGSLTPGVQTVIDLDRKPKSLVLDLA